MIIIFYTCGIVSAETRLRVGYVPVTGFLEEDRAGHFRGYGYEYMEFLSKYGDWKFEYIPCTTWRECGEKLQNGLIDVLPAMPGDYRSLQNVTRTDHVIGRYPMELVTHDGKIHSSMRIGTIPSSPPLPSLPKVAANEGFSYELVQFNTFYDMEEAFKRRELDGYIGPMLEPNKENNVASIFDRQSYRLLVRSDRTDLLAAMNIAMDEMLMDQPNIRNRLNDKYFRESGSPLILNRQEKEYLQQKQKLKTAILVKEKPYAYTDGKGELHGVIPRIIQQIASDLNIEIEIVDTKSPAEAAQLIKTGQLDFVADAVCDFSWASDLNMSPTQSYLQLEYVAVTRRNVDEEDSLIVACDKSLLYTQNFIFPRFDEQHRVYADNLRECFKLLSEGEADILFAPRNEVPYLMEDAGTYNLDIASESAFSDSLSLGIYNKADSRLWRILNKEVNHLDMGKIRISVNEDMNTASHGLSPQWLIYQYPVRAMMIFLLIIAIIGAAIRYRFYLRRKQTEIIENMAYTDSRYNLPNEAYFEEEAPKIYSELEEDEGVYIVKFASFYDHKNNLVSDRNLRDEQLKNMANGISQKDWNLLTTIGDESGTLISMGIARSNAEIVQQAKDAIQEFGYIITNSSRIWLNMKVGISKVEGDDIIKAIENANIACRQARDDILLFDGNFEKKLEFEADVEKNMRAALENNEFQAWYQSEYELKTLKTVGGEAYIRWQSSALGFLLPEKFIGIFERNGFILLTDYFIFEEVCKLQRARIDENSEVIPMSINQSSLHLTEEHYVEKIKSIFKKYKLPKGIIKLEFSERAFENLDSKKNVERINGIIRALQKIGIKVTIDKFGSNYSSYKLLNSLPIDEIKVDRMIVESSTNSNKMRDILDNIIKLGNKLKIRVVCEGIETKEQESLIIELGCKYGQGFLNSESSPLQ